MISEAIWRNPQALAASRNAAAAVGVDMVASAGCVIRAVDEYGLVFSSARKAWQEVYAGAPLASARIPAEAGCPGGTAASRPGSGTR